MRKTLIAAALAAAIATPLAAQNAAAPAAPAAQAQQPQPGGAPEDRARAAIIMRTFMVAMNSDKVQPAVKNRLATCIYNNPLRSLSVATGNVFARNTSLDPKNPQHVYAVAARVCGVQPPESAQAPAAAQTPAPEAR